MRNIFLGLFITFSTLFSAQNTAEKQFVQQVNKLYLATNYQDLAKLENKFAKISNEGKGWYTSYYNAFISIQKAKMKLDAGDKKYLNGYFQTAIKTLSPIYKSQKNNVEVNALMGLAYFMKSKYTNTKKDTFKKEALKYYAICKKLNKKNDRVLLLGELLTKGSVKFEKQIVLNQNTLDPVWGANNLGSLITEK